MARDYTVTIDGVSYHGTTASAKNQMEALHIAMRSGLIATLETEHSEIAVVSAFARLAYEDVQKLSGLLVTDCINRDADNVPAAENLFADDIQNYYLLLHHALKENIGGFWRLRRQTESQAAAEQAS